MKKETDLIQDGSQIKRQKDIYYHGPKNTLIIYHLCNPSHFSLGPTFKIDLFSHVQIILIEYIIEGGSHRQPR